MYARAKGWLQGFDQNRQADALDRASDARLRQAASLEAQRLGYAKPIASGQRGVETLGDEITALLGRRARSGEPAGMAPLRATVSDLLYGGAAPADIRTPAGAQQLQGLLGQMGVGIQRAEGVDAPESLVQLANALAQANAIQRPGVGASFHGAVAGLNDTLATSGLARGMAVGSALAGAGAAVPLVTSAGQQLIALMSNLNDAQEQEEKSRYGVQV